MGWYGNYSHPDDVVEEKVSFARRNNIEILDTKTTKNWGGILYKNEVGNIIIDFFIFREEMYKPLSWADRPNVIPSKWITAVLPFASDYERKLYEEYKAEKQKKKAEPKLDDVLVVGQKYLVWGKHEAIYSHKYNRSHVFILPGEGATRFRNLKVTDLQKI